MLKIIMSILVLLFSKNYGQITEMKSPDGKIEVRFKLEDGIPYYSVEKNRKEIIKPSRLGFILKNSSMLDDSMRIDYTQAMSYDQTWTQIWGEKKDIRNNYKELSIYLIEETEKMGRLQVIFRVYNDGVGFRYQIQSNRYLNEIEVMDELTEFNFTDDHSSWWIGAFWWNRYEYLYRNTPLSETDTVQTPFTMETKDGIYLSIHEAALIDYPSMALENIGNNKFKACLYPWSDGVKVKGRIELKSPWRTIQISDSPGGLIESYLILNLNEPCKLFDPGPQHGDPIILKPISWAKPAKYIGIWWEMHLGISTWGSGPNHGANTQNAKKYIDFAAKYGFDAVLIEGWNTGWDGDWIQNGDIFSFTTAHPDFDLEEVVRYANEKGVQITGHHETGGSVINYERQMDSAYALYERLGINTVKTGYVNHGQNIKRIDENGNVQLEWHHGQYMVRHYQKTVEEAAKYKIMLNIHEPIKDTGLRRTYPNLMTREGARGQEYDAWDAEGGNPPDHTTILPFTRLLSGPMDFTPGIFDLTFDDIPGKENNRVNTTIAKQLAHYVILYSPLQMAADLPENYEANPEPFKFIVDVPVDWEDTKVINGKIGDYVTIVRKDRNSPDWYLGSITDEEARTFDISLDFLVEGKKYIAEIYRDGENADWKTNPYEIVIEETEVDKTSVLNLKLAPGGGTAIRFREKND
jgi:alpha-glucosidase